MIGIRLATIASFTTASEADLARSQLALVGIRARLDNAALATWFWHYSNAVGGVRLMVTEPDVGLALETLRDSRRDRKDASTRCCPGCDREVPSQWDICWNCGADAEGNRPDTFAADDVAPGAIDPVSLALLGFGATLFGTLCLVAFPAWVVPAAVLAAVLLIVGIVAELTFADGRPDATDSAAVEIPDGKLPEPEAETNPAGEAVARKAWWAAVFGLLHFPLFTLVSFWLLLHYSPSGGSLSRAARRRRVAAWTVSLLTLQLWLYPVVALATGNDALGWFFLYFL